MSLISVLSKNLEEVWSPYSSALTIAMSRLCTSFNTRRMIWDLTMLWSTSLACGLQRDLRTSALEPNFDVYFEVEESVEVSYSRGRTILKG